MVELSVKENQSFHINGEDGKPLCSHNDVDIIKACCNPSHRGSSGYIECGCNGTDEVVCNNPDCHGLTDDDVEEFVTDCWG